MGAPVEILPRPSTRRLVVARSIGVHSATFRPLRDASRGTQCTSPAPSFFRADFPIRDSRRSCAVPAWLCTVRTDVLLEQVVFNCTWEQ